MATKEKRPAKAGVTDSTDDSSTPATIQLTSYKPTRSELERYYRALHSTPRTLGRFTSAYYLTGKHTPKLPAPLIDGILSRRAKLLITAPPKAGKSHLATDLAMAVATGSKWLGRFKCRKSATLYLNAEIDGDEFANRMEHIRKKRGYTPGEIANLYVLNTLGVCDSIGDAVEVVTDAVEQALEIRARIGSNLDFVVIDPVYMFEEGSENDAEIVIKLMRALDPLLEAGLSVALVHHQPKGENVGNRPLTDRAAGSNVWTRNSNQMLDLTPKVLDKAESAKLRANHGEKARVFRLEYGGRSFEGGECAVVWDWPLFTIDDDFSGAPVEGSRAARQTKGANQSRERSERRNANNAVLLDRAVERPRKEGKPTTRKDVYPAFLEECKKEGVGANVAEASFGQWFTPSKAKYPYRADPERGNQLFKIDQSTGEFIE